MRKLSSLDIKHLMEREQCFVLYRLPDEEQAYCFLGKGLKVLTSIKDLEEGFVFAPFEIKTKSPLLLIKGEKEVLEFDYQNNKTQTILNSEDKVKHKESYIRDFNCFQKALEQNHFKKLVLARSKDLDFEEILDIKTLFVNACQHYPNAYCYLIYTPLSGIWLGASPECLFSSQGKDCSTVALAGTQAISNKSEELVWSEKLKEEQSLVLRFIEEALQSIGIKLEQSETYSISAGHLAHLKTDISFRLNKTQDIPQVLEQLHPTPALCGLSKDEAKAFILANESLKRAYYGGFFGFIKAEESSKLYVNIRCMQMLSPKSIRLYAGGGLLKASKLEDEWQETEAKMKTMLKIL